MSRPLQRGLGASQRPFAERFRGASPQLWRSLSSRDGGKASTRSGAPVLLPKTKLPMRANAAVRELEAVEDTTEKLYSWQRERKSDRRDFILHDGPPYANGDLHTGHFLNKCLKDFINRFQLLKGRRVHYVPGWDCHGLPIELKALSKKSAKGTRDPKVIRELARKCAEDAIASQKAGFKRWGVMANWDSKTYATFDKSYEAAQLDVFGQLVKRGFVRRGLKPVYWSYSSRTALAEAEIEYQDAFESPSCFVDFEITGLSGHEEKGELTQGMALVKRLIEENRLRTTAWTTTPWTLLSNVALAVQPTVEYSLVTSGDAHPVRLLASERLEDPTVKEFFACEGGDMVMLGTVLGRELDGITYKHPLQSTEDGDGPGFKIILGDHVTTDSGTGVVHTAPSHGQDDFIAWKNNGGNLEECPCPIDDSGSFFKESPKDGARARIGCDALWESLSGLHIHKGGNEAVLDLLEKAGALPVPSTPHVHRYPIDWRTKKPVITRATEQWFVNLSALKGLASEALEDVELVPASSRARLGSMVQGRDEWCISRQRVWGVPIPALYTSSGTAKVWMDEFLVEAVREVVAEDGTDAWFTSPSPAFETQLAERANALRAAAGLDKIELEDGASWQRGTDTLDVWFDSGSSWRAVLSETLSESEDVAKLCADVYLEGSDQHRGWFQSSLLTKVASTFKEGVAARAPFDTIITHGFVLDEKDQKMSKSLGNTIVPDDVIHGKGSFKGQAAYGVDVLRLWAASTDFSRDVPLSKAVVKDASDDVRKIRNVARFLLGNLHDFDPSKHSSVDELDVTKFNPLDRYMLDKTNRFVSAADAAYSSFHFRGVFSELMRFVSNDVSALYSTAAKDRLYCDPRDDLSRRQCQAVLWEILQAVTVVAAPILCYTAEEIHRFARDEVGPFPSKWRSDSDKVFSVFQASFPKQNPEWLLSEQESASWERLLHVRRAVNKLIGDQERSGAITSSEQVVINVTPITGEDFHWFTESKGLEQTLVSLTNVADCVFSPAIDGASDPVAPPSTTVVEQGLGLSVEKTTFGRCSRCRRHTVPPSSGDVAGDASFCPRCSSVGLDQ